MVGTLGTALGEDHLRALKRLADRVVLVYDADEAGQNAADRALEFFLGSDLDLRVLTLPANLDPCDYLLEEGAEAFRAMVEQAADPLAYLLARAEERFDLDVGRGLAPGCGMDPGPDEPRARDASSGAGSQTGQGARHAYRTGCTCRLKP